MFSVFFCGPRNFQFVINHSPWPAQRQSPAHLDPSWQVIQTSRISPCHWWTWGWIPCRLWSSGIVCRCGVQSWFWTRTVQVGLSRSRTLSHTKMSQWNLPHVLTKYRQQTVTWRAFHHGIWKNNTVWTCLDHRIITPRARRTWIFSHAFSSF